MICCICQLLIAVSPNDHTVQRQTNPRHISRLTRADVAWSSITVILGVCEHLRSVHYEGPYLAGIDNGSVGQLNMRVVDGLRSIERADRSEYRWKQKD